MSPSAEVFGSDLIHGNGSHLTAGAAGLTDSLRQASLTAVCCQSPVRRSQVLALPMSHLPVAAAMFVGEIFILDDI